MKIKIILVLTVSIITQHIIADPIITFFMRPFPYISDTQKEITKERAERKSKKLRLPGKIAYYTLRPLLQTSNPAGIFSTYNGQLALSDLNGQVTFARQQTKPKIKLLITNRIEPILMAGQTIHHWQLELGAPAKMYLVKQKEDETTSIEFWNVQEIPLPENNRIPLNTIVIFAKPSHIFVPQGITTTEANSQLILPDIYVKKNIDKLTNSFYVLRLKRFFNQTKERYQTNEKEFSVIVY